VAQDLASRRLTLILGASLVAVIALGVWIAVLIGRAQPDQDPQTPSTTSQTSALEDSDEPPEGDGTPGEVTGNGASPTAEQTEADTATTTEEPRASSSESSAAPVSLSTSDDGGSQATQTSESDTGGGASSDTDVVQSSP